MPASSRPDSSDAPAVGTVGEAALHAQRDADLATWLAGAARGRAEDFERFYDATVGYARALARRIVPADDVDDALAEAYLDAWRQADRYDPQRGSVQAPLEEDARASDAAGPPDRLWQAEAGHCLHAALAGLSAQERWVLGLAYFRDLAHPAIAEATGLPLGTVKSLILRAHAKLRRQLAALT